MANHAAISITVAVLVGGACGERHVTTPPPRPAAPQVVQIDVTHPPPPPAAPSPAEQAIAAHRDELLAHPGVVDVVASSGGDAVVVELCANEAAAGLDLDHLGVPATTATGAWKQTASGEPCGCVVGGAYVRDGAPFQSECTTCLCNRPCTVTAGCDDLHAQLEPPPPVVFLAGTATLARGSEVALAALRDKLKALDDQRAAHSLAGVATVAVHGHAGPKEKNAQKLSEQRAKVVRDLLVTKYGLEPTRIVGVDGAAATGDAPAPVVTFELRPPAPPAP
ncbi:MAG TPA: hypothetical protein VHE35_03320 [Kofleriaceae bacterium]|nr:hypothetical protein [Kofleriaceae bacterium]